MSSRTIKILAIAVVVLFAVVFTLNRPGEGDGAASQELLFPGLKDRLDEVSEITITDADSEIAVARADDGWVIPGKGSYQANTGTLRELLLAIADARKVEQKTSNGELYQRLGVQDPAAEGSTGVLVESSGLGDADFALILGDSVRGEYRYVRIADAAPSWLIDKNLEVPDDPGGWLEPEIVDIPSSSIQSVTITHADDETIAVRKENSDATNFEVTDIPEGRELSYPSVANSIAAALDNLTLEDVRRAKEGEGAAPESAGATATVFTTFDGLQVRVESTAADDETWITLEASVAPDASGETIEEEETAPAAAQEASSGSESAPAGDEISGETAEEPDPAAEAAAINARVAGWEYRIAEYKANQVTRRWEDLLQSQSEE